PGVVYDGNDREVVTERPSHDDSRSSPLRLLLDLGRVRYRNFRCSMRPPGTPYWTNSSLSLMASPVFGSQSLPLTLRDGLRDICQRGAARRRTMSPRPRLGPCRGQCVDSPTFSSAAPFQLRRRDAG